MLGRFPAGLPGSRSLPTGVTRFLSWYRWLVPGLCLVGVAFCSPAPAPPADHPEERERMVREQIEARGIVNPEVLAALRAVPRHLFVPLDQEDQAYQDHPLPIGEGQTISQPYIVAFMTELARPGEEDRVLEVGTGSGYQAAVISEIVKEVFTIEIVESLGLEARERLRTLGYDRVHVRIGDGYGGWPEEAPFDVILVTAAPDHVPPELVKQLAPGGRMVIPVGPMYRIQSLQLIEKDVEGGISRREVLPVRFVPLTRSP